MNQPIKHKKAEMTHPPRGIIVVDTSTLLHLCVPLSQGCMTKEASKKGKPVCLADGLKWLASHGYEVIIPEMVANECGGFMRDGASIRDYSPNVIDLWHSLTKDFFHSIPNTAIQIMPASPHDTSLGARYLNENYSIHRNPHWDAPTKLQHFASANIRYGKKMHRGDKAAYEIIKGLGTCTAPIFYLTEDHGAWDAITKLDERASINRINLSGLHSALEQNRVLPEFGIKDIPVDKLNAFTGYHLSKAIKHKSYFKINPTDEGLEVGKNNQHPFLTDLSQWMVLLKQHEMLSEEALRTENPTLAHEDYVRSYQQYVANRDTATVKGR
jgi:hypothetical protein